MRIFAQSKQKGVDGIFVSCPDLCAQLYVIMGWYKGTCNPVAFVLLEGKKMETYKRKIKELMNVQRSHSGCP